MLSSHSQHQNDVFDLTLPERMGQAAVSPLLLSARLAALSSKLNTSTSLIDLRTNLHVCLPWHGPPPLIRRSKASPVPLKPIVAIVSVLVLAGCLRWGASPAILFWWAVATGTLLWYCAVQWSRANP